MTLGEFMDAQGELVAAQARVHHLDELRRLTLDFQDKLHEMYRRDATMGAGICPPWTIENGGFELIDDVDAVADRIEVLIANLDSVIARNKREADEAYRNLQHAVYADFCKICDLQDAGVNA